MKEVIYPKPEYATSNTEERCPLCQSQMRHQVIACPEGKPGCLVLHYGYRCLSTICGMIFQ